MHYDAGTSNAAAAASPWTVEVAHGPDAGRHWVLPVGRALTIGRADIADPTISTQHLVVGEQWQDTEAGTGPLVRNLSQTNPATWLAAPGSIPVQLPHQGTWASPTPTRVCIGASVVLLTPVAHGTVSAETARRSSGSTKQVRVDRPPLIAPAPVWQPVDVPTVAAARQVPRLSIAGLVLPVVTGAVLALLINPMLAVMAAMSPVLMLGSWLEERRRVRRDRAKGLRSTAEQLAFFEQSLLQTIDTCTDDLFSRNPSNAELCRFADVADFRLWERRLDHPDAGLVTIGLGTLAAPHRLNRVAGTQCHSIAEATADRLRFIDQVPVVVSLSPERIVGVIGDRAEAAALVRSMVAQLSVMHGPADLRLAFIADPAATHDWEWAATLPHTSTGCDPLMSCGPDTIRSVLEDLERSPMWTVLTVDASSLRDHPSLRCMVGALPKWLTVVVIAERIDQIPQRATATIIVRDALAELMQNPPTAHHAPGTPVVVSGLGVARARRIAEALSTCQDGALLDDGSALAPLVRLGDLLGASSRDERENTWAAHLQSSWDPARHVRMNRLVATIGLAGTDPVTVDLVSDGPHALIAGTTGSGKSELLRTLVCSLAAGYSPQQLTFVLIDYKGGAAFTGLDALPHTVGFVTDLDDGLGSRALTCLEAELRHRELMLSSAGCDDITTYPHAAPDVPAMPRLVVMIDEFATMLAELPDFISALIGIAQRGRSLGVHLILATQRPAGAVNDSIRANTNLRMCLRVQTAADSSDVIGSPRAAMLDRRFPGRAVLRTGPDEFIAMQTASCTVRQAVRPVSPRLGCPDFSAPSPAGFRRSVVVEGETDKQTEATPTGSNDLEVVVKAAQSMAAQMGIAPPRRPWPEPLPDNLSLLAPGSPAIQLGLIDLPELQRTDGLSSATFRANTVLFGAAGSGVSTALAAVAAALMQECDPNTMHLYLVDHGAGVFAGLESSPHVGARITATEPERLDRLTRVLGTLIETRRADRESRPDVQHPQVIVFVDDWGALRSASDDILGTAQERWFRIFADGPSVGITAVISADRAQALPGSALAAFAHRFAFRLNDPLDDAMLGISRSAPPRSVSGRAIDLGSGAAVQFATCDLHPAIRTENSDPVKQRLAPARIELLPSSLSAQTVWERAADQSGPVARQASPEHLSLPIGIGDTDLALVGWRLQQGEHLLITGPGRAGKSNMLSLVAAAARAERPHIQIVALGSSRSPIGANLTDLGIDHTLAYDLAEAVTYRYADLDATDASCAVGPRPFLLLVDDAELIDDQTGEMAKFIAGRGQNVWIVATGRADSLRNAYGHWTVPLRRSRKGLALRPHVEMDGELWATPLPRNHVRGGGRVMPVGRGYLLDDGHAELVQTGHVDLAQWTQLSHVEPATGPLPDPHPEQMLFDGAKQLRFSPIECGRPATGSRRIAS